MTNELELAKIISFTRELESILKEKFQAKGKGLHTYIDSIENKLDERLVKDLRYLATIRNKSMHESSFKVDNFSRYKRVAEQSIYRLNNLYSQVNRKRDDLNINRPRLRPKPKHINRKRDNISESENLLKDIILLAFISMILFIYVLDNKFSEVEGYISTFIVNLKPKEEFIQRKKELKHIENQNIESMESIYLEEEIAKLEKEIAIEKLKNPKKIEEKFKIIEDFSYKSSKKSRYK